MPVPTPSCRRWLPALLPLLLAGCGGGNNAQAFAPACPTAAILADAADISRYTAGGRDLTDLALNGRITGVAGKCSRGEDGVSLHTEVAVQMEVGRGPAAHGRNADFAYFVAVTRDGQILDKRVLPVQVAFPANTDRVSVTGEPLVLSLPTPKGVGGPDYRILVGFQLTPGELALNRSREAR